MTAATFARLCREAKFQNMCWGGEALYRSAEFALTGRGTDGG